MAITLDPSPDQLGIAAPHLGRWFSFGSSSDTLTLPAPTAGSSLGLSITFPNSDTKWLPPATGFLGLFIGAPANPPERLASLRDAQGGHPFATGEIVAHFSILPEVEARLHTLMRHVPPLTEAQQGVVESASGPPTRVRVRSFALAFPAPADQDYIAAIDPLVPVPPDMSDNDIKARYWGLEPTTKGGKTLTNSDRPMSQLLRPGQRLPVGGSLGGEDVILVGLKGKTAKLWAFDARGRAIDPGAVAAWFSYLAQQVVGDEKLVARPGSDEWPKTSNGDKRVCLFADAHTVHLVNAHQGKLDVEGDPFVKGGNGRLQLGGSSVSQTVLVNSNEMSFAFSPLPSGGTPPAHNPTLDSAPVPRLAVLPNGDYRSTLKLWLSGKDVSTGLSRDFARVAVLDIERHLVGIPRGDSASVGSNAEAKRKADQNRPSTRVSVEAITVPASDPVLLATIDETVTRIGAVFSEGTTTRLVVGVADAQAGALSPAALTLPTTAELPSTLVEMTETGDLTKAGTYAVRALVGCGKLNGTDLVDQQVLVEVMVAAAGTLKDSWVRAWPLGFDFRRAEHFRMDGGAGRVGDDGIARLVMTLPDSQAKNPSLPGFDLMISGTEQNGRTRTRNYGDCRYHRPQPDNSTTDLPDPTSSNPTNWYICEQGKSGTGNMTGVTVNPGETVVLKNVTTKDGTTTTTYTLGRRSKLPLVTTTLGGVIASGDIVALTQPAFKITPDRIDERGMQRGQESSAGDPKGGLDKTTGTIVDHTGRLTNHHSISSHPYATQDRLEVVASRLDSADAHAVIGSAPLWPRVHEVLPHFAGHPGAPATTELHGTGVRLQGRSAAWAAEYMLDRTAGLETKLSDLPSWVQDLGILWTRSEAALAWAAAKATAPNFPAAPTDPSRWAAVLRTVAFGVEGLPGAGVAAEGAYPLSALPAKLFDWLNGLSILPSSFKLGDKLKQAIGTQPDTVIRNIARALDRRLKAGIQGYRETAFALKDAFSRAEDLVYIETPALDTKDNGPTGDTVNVLNQLITRLGEAKGLHVVICVPSQLPPNMPRVLEEIRDAETLDAIKALRAAAGKRVACYSPGTGAGRSLRLASTTVIVDDVFALTGTTHLWRRGLTFDSSYAAAVFDEKVSEGRPKEVLDFRRKLLAGRLGVPASMIPDDPDELVRAIQDYDVTGSFRLAFRPLLVPPTLAPGAPEPVTDTPKYPTETDRNMWNPDGANNSGTISFDDLSRFFLGASTGASPSTEINDPV